jgi:diguanylate cyclase (GGDEF)-like protein/PAS domain S-box-containing protein
MFANLVNNIAFLIALVAVGQMVLSRADDQPKYREGMLGLLFGVVALLGMANPVNYAPGVFFDGRSIVLAVAGVVGGGVAAAIAAAMAAVYRLVLGGAGAPVGVAVVLLSALLGVVARHWWLRRSQPPRPVDYLALGVAVQLMQLAAFTQVPNRAGYAFIEQAWWVLLLCYPLATMLLCVMFRNFEQQVADKAALNKAQDARVAQELAGSQRFHAYFDQSIVGLAITSLEKGWIEVNDALCDTLGYTRDQLTRMTWAELTHPDDLAPDLAQFNRMLAGEISSYAMDKRFIHKSGRVVYTRLAVSHVRKPDGSPDYVLAMVEDISDRKQAEEKLMLFSRDFEAFLDQTTDFVYFKDADSRFRFCSQPLAAITGHADWRAMVGKHDREVFPPDTASIYEAEERPVFAEGKPVLGKVNPYYDAAGRTGYVQTNKWPLFNAEGKVVGLFGISRDITERKQAEADLLNEKRFSEDTLEALPGVFYMFDATGRFVRWNRQFGQILGYTDAELAAMQAPDFFVGDDRQRISQAVQLAFIDGQADVAADFQTKDGRSLPFHFTGQRSVIGEQTYLLGVGIDISEQRLAQQALEKERAMLRTLVSTIPDLISLKNAEGVYLSCNPEFERFFGAVERDIVGKTDHDFVARELADSFREHDRAAMAAGEATRNEEWITYASDGRRVLLETTKVPMRAPDGKLLGVLGISHDITEREAHQKQLEHIAHFDLLTGLPNRVLLADRLQQALAQAVRRRTLLAVAYLDLDGFKEVNDRYGHDVGDHLLTALSAHMKRALREGDTLARIGGDEFVAVLLDLPAVESAAPLLSRLLAAASQVVYHGGEALRVSASVGVTYFPQAEAVEADQLLRQADQAMYQAKQMGKNRYHIFDAEHDRNMRGHHEDMEQIERALKAEEFVLHYQPKVNMRTGEVVGAEALIRWQHPVRGLLPPAAFLSQIADHPLAIRLGEWVLDTALTQMERWQAAGLTLPVSVNIDAIQLEQPDFVGNLQRLMAAHPLVGPGDLELEVLETSALDDMAKVSDVMLACRDMGIGFALDDFGTGYSSLTYLKRLPAGLLKIDQSFVRDMLDDPDDLSILQGVLGLSRAFQRRVIAEGVETLAHGDMLLHLGCELGQGYAIARPMPAENLPTWVGTWRPAPSWLNQAPISHADLPILFASVEHRVWVNQVVSFVRGEGDAPPPVHPDHCRVGLWMKTEVPLLRADKRLAAEALGPLHNAIHERAGEMIDLKQAGQTEAALEQLDALYRLRDQLLLQFAGLLKPG